MRVRPLCHALPCLLLYMYSAGHDVDAVDLAPTTLHVDCDASQSTHSDGDGLEETLRAGTVDAPFRSVHAAQV